MGVGSSQTQASPSLGPAPTRNDWNAPNTHGGIYRDVHHLKESLRRVGAKKVNLIIGIDFTASNKWTGKVTFGGKNLHDLSTAGILNPYEQAITIIGESLREFIDGPIPVYGFGCSKTRDTMVFAFNEGDMPCRNLREVLDRYREMVPKVTLAGPTSFAPIIQKACAVTNQAGNKFHVLVIIADGQVTRPDGQPGHVFSPQEHATIRAIVNACNFPLSIVCVGVGDGPWESMHHFDNKIANRPFDNFRFVSLSESLSRVQAMNPHDHPQDLKKKMDDRFAVEALHEVPNQYSHIRRLNLLGMEAAYLSVRKIDASVATVYPSSLNVPDSEPPTGHEDTPQRQQYLPIPGNQPYMPNMFQGGPPSLPMAHPQHPTMIPTPVNMPPPPANMTYAIAPTSLGLPANSVIVAPISDCIRANAGPMPHPPHNFPHHPPPAGTYSLHAPTPMGVNGPLPPPTAMHPSSYASQPSFRGVLPPPMPVTQQQVPFNHLPSSGVLPPPTGAANAASVPASGTNTNRHSRPHFDYTNPNASPTQAPPAQSSTNATAVPSASAPPSTTKSTPAAAANEKTDGTGGSGGRAESECPVCFGEIRNVALQCGHVYCHDCAHALDTCAICRQTITSRIRLFT